MAGSGTEVLEAEVPIFLGILQEEEADRWGEGEGGCHRTLHRLTLAQIETARAGIPWAGGEHPPRITLPRHTLARIEEVEVDTQGLEVAQTSMEEEGVVVVVVVVVVVDTQGQVGLR